MAGKGKVGRRAGQTSVSGSSKAGIVFPTGRCNRLLRAGRFSERCSASSGVFMAAVLEYITQEVLDLSANCAAEHKKTRILPRHMKLAIMNDPELEKLVVGTTIIESGVLPNVNSFLFPKSVKK